MTVCDTNVSAMFSLACGLFAKSYAHLFGVFFLVVSLDLASSSTSLCGHIAPSQAIANVDAGGCGLLVSGHCRVARSRIRLTECCIRETVVVCLWYERRKAVSRSSNRAEGRDRGLEKKFEKKGRSSSRSERTFPCGRTYTVLTRKGDDGG